LWRGWRKSVKHYKSHKIVIFYVYGENPSPRTPDLTQNMHVEGGFRRNHVE